jgi:hypothetical protein
MSPRSQKYGTSSSSAMRSSGYGYPQYEQEEEEEEEQPQQRRSYGSTGRNNVQQQQSRYHQEQEDDDDDEEDHYYRSKKVGYPKPTAPTSSGRFSQHQPVRMSTNSNVAMKAAGSSRLSAGSSHVREMESGWKNTMDDPPYSSRSVPKTNSSYRNDDYDVADRYQSNNNPSSTRNAGLISRREVPVRSTSGRFPSEPVVPQFGSSSIRGAANISVPSSLNRPNDPVRFNPNSSRR